MRPAILLPLAFLLALPAAASAQNEGAANAELIRNALSAAPESVAEHATVANFDGTVLREGNNGWVCMPDLPEIANNSPMCLDANWRELIDAMQNKREPKYTGTAISYMLQSDMPVSNTDPYATAGTPDNQWIQAGVPHIMVAISDTAMLEGLSTDPDNGGPWVMWKGTPYAHIMIPTVSRAD
jgi:hypothetical protein